MRPRGRGRGIISLKTVAARRTAIFVRSQGFSPHLCAAPGSTFRAWWKQRSRPQRPVPPSSASWPRCADRRAVDGQVAAGIEAIRNEVDINIACSLGMLSASR
ncbi:hypothetical protein I553_3943 [Mycobacterium xenopi 4042]|uniref:Uncharacterized protein n=1 Tax=Mycobacterium xenopi 4042 TaxID=1299334 RepID=X8DL79_MYCXE|nr:hypothetical protein I553_3943 [Mycobacterium xenopi 4042]